jgi:competence protein ComEC
LKKKLFNVFTLAALLIFAGYLLVYATKPAKDHVAIHFLNVGQGDATYIEISENQDLLIDGGPSGDTVKNIERYKPFFDREIKSIVLTHPHRDHYGGLEKVVESYKVRDIYLTKATNDEEYGQFIDLVKARNISIHYVKKGDEIQFEKGVKFVFLTPEATDYKNENINNTSIVGELVWGKNKALFMGDLEADEQHKLTPLLTKINLLKVSHHCSADAFDENFYKAIMPEYSVISVGKGNAFGHPSQKCLDIIKNSKVFRTDLDGDIGFDMTTESLVVK